MLTEVDILSDLTDSDKAVIFQILDGELNPMILKALLHGMYTGILAVTLWNIFINKCWCIRRALVVVIILLHVLITISFADSWSHVHSAFIENGKSFWSAYLSLCGSAQSFIWIQGMAACMSTILTDSYMIWCCWMVWGQRWVVVLLPILSLICATVSKAIEIYHGYSNAPDGVFPTLYISFLLATTLWCTILIIYRILAVTRAKHGASSGLRVYRRFIEVLIESSALYSISLVVYLAFAICGDIGMVYLDPIAGIAKGITPTLLIGRAAAGHTRPNDDYNENTVSSLHFQAPSEVGTTTFQESTMESTVLETDIEAQHQQSDELMIVVERHNSVQDE